MNNEKEDWALEQDLKYNRLTAFKLFAMTSSMVISVDELAPFGKTGATALFLSIDCWNCMVYSNYSNGR